MPPNQSTGGTTGSLEEDLLQRVREVEQTLVPATSYKVRDDLGELISRDLLGPWGGSDEEFDYRAAGPRDRYLVGMIGPKRALTTTLASASEQLLDDSDGEGDGSDQGLPERLTAQNAGRMWASSMGLMFAVAANDSGAEVSVRVRWGRYHRSQVLGEDGVARSTWTREQVEQTHPLRLDGPAHQVLPLTSNDTEAPGVRLVAEVRDRQGAAGPTRVVELALVNAQDEPQQARDTAWLFQTELHVTAADGTAAVFLPISDPLDEVEENHGPLGGADPEEDHLTLLYRNHLKHAAGRNVAVDVTVVEGERQARALTTTWLPVHDVPATIAPSGKRTRNLEGLELSMDELAVLPPAALTEALAPLADGYSAWLDEREAEAGQLTGTLRESALDAVRRARDVAVRITLGVDLLSHTDRPEVLEAFRFANRAMALQRRHTAIAALREREGIGFDEARKRIAAQGAAGASWRPFQLAFVLLNLRALADPVLQEREAGPDAVVDLLFFPTGGGKTEAYLGLAAFTFAIRRLQGTIGSGEDARSGEAGVAVLMRYTLRLLTAQQFQRAAALVCAAEVLRREAYDGGDYRWGETPFRIGLWVGGAVSPNRYEEAEQQVAEAKDAGDGRAAKVLQTLACPWCGTALSAQRDLYPDPDLRRVLLYCANGEGKNACPFSERRSRHEGLPILTVDEEIYRLAPSLLIATVDKLAQLPWRGQAGMLFGRVSELCPRHGYRHPDLDARTKCTEKHQAKPGHEAVKSRAVTRLRPPDLIIQDELHLISGALGTTVGLFEAAVDELCGWQVPGRDGSPQRVGPKIVASTATTKRAAEQIQGVFARKAAIFPPQVIDVGDTFFSQQVPLSPKAPGRRYLGICAHGVRMKQAEIRVAEILLLAGQTLFDRHGKPADPYMTLVGYFNATRELAGMRRFLDDDIATRVRIHGARKGMSNRLLRPTEMLSVQELTSRISSGDITEVLARMDVGFNEETDTTVRRQAVVAELRAAAQHKQRLDPAKLGLRNEGNGAVDAVIATSMLQVGVDVPRFGLMMVVGQPKNTAEYIQASSRVGREAERPGLVVTLYNWTRPRDLAHFENFGHYHATFYRQVEALSVTPFARRSLDRTTAGAWIGAVRNATLPHSRNGDAYDIDLDGSVARQVTERFLARAETVSGPRARGYLAERIEVLKDAWAQKKQGSARLGYEEARWQGQQLTGLLNRATGAVWDELTVAQSMRETENEINLLVPGSGLYDIAGGAPDWTYDGGSGAGGTEDGDSPDGDETGAVLDTKAAAAAASEHGKKAQS
ncbi:helicase [Streptomyces sp. ID38640]|uniref:DISARM system helicase DrmA n=1 Tax=Streptomyces sp. ID38640 TaxID=1265399 RepID=UPI00140ED4DE|nr:DISARM system helicase DrmA [Streptomyces sp. ID38640]QIK06144.1 helicase [Streptomyces sp. ID38640]